MRKPILAVDPVPSVKYRGRPPARIRIGVVALGALLVAIALALTLALLTGRSEAAAAGACEDVVVSVDWDHGRAETVSGIVVRVGYPASVAMPAQGEPRSAKERVRLLVDGSGGLFDAVPRDGNRDGRDDVVSVGLIRQGIASGPFARLRFDCAPGAPSRTASDFTCVSDVADQSGSVPSSCRVALASE